MMDTRSSYLRAIATAYPDVDLSDAVLDTGGGQHNHIVRLGERFIFRFPRFPEGELAMVREIQILAWIRGKTTMMVPEPRYFNPGEKDGDQVFMGYPRLPGIPLGREEFKRVQDEIVRAKLASQLARFLNELHSIPIEGLDFPIEDGPEYWGELYMTIRDCLFEYMNEAGRQKTQEHFEAYLDDPALQRFEPAIRHGDFGGTNLLYDQDRGAMSAVIDFSFSGIGDPAVDIAAAQTFGPAFFKYYKKHYPLSPETLARADFYRGTFALQESVYGIENQDIRAFDEGLVGYR
jgi:aminoglycoside 2''-phosphotransferase